MQPYQIRVIEEKISLAVKLVALREYMGGSFLVSETGYLKLPLAEQLRLRRQYSAMQDYSSILGERIEAFDCPPPVLPISLQGPAACSAGTAPCPPVSSAKDVPSATDVHAAEIA